MAHTSENRMTETRRIQEPGSLLIFDRFVSDLLHTYLNVYGWKRENTCTKFNYWYWKSEKEISPIFAHERTFIRQSVGKLVHYENYGLQLSNIQGQNFRQVMAFPEDWRKKYARAQKSALDNFERWALKRAGICVKYFLSFPQKTCHQRKLRQTK